MQCSHVPHVDITAVGDEKLLSSELMTLSPTLSHSLSLSFYLSFYLAPHEAVSVDSE